MVAIIAAAPFALIYVGKYIKALPFMRHDLSYGIYLYSWPIQEIVVYESRKYGISLSGTEVFFSALVPVVVLAAVSCVLIEPPVLRLKGTYRTGRQQA